LNSGHKYSVNALDRFQLVLASMWMPKKELQEKIKASDFTGAHADYRARVHVNGTAVYDLDLIKAIEECGGFVACDDLCTGSRYFWENVEKTEDPISALAHRYLGKTPCPSNAPLAKRLEYINLMIKQFEARGVITFTEKFCDPMLYDAVHIRNNLAENRVPTMVIDYENPAQEIGRIKTRVEAFVESLGE
jgi:benzoyl-CoA reductase subunit C